MASAQDLQALFQGVLTPLQMQQQEAAQEQQMMQFYAQDGDRPWRLELERSLNNLGKALPNSPYQQQKRQAEVNQSVLANSTKRYNDLVKEGVDPGEAQMAIIGNAIDEFAKQGNYDAISALAPTYLALQTKQAETAKLKQQTRTSAAQETLANTRNELEPVKVLETVRTGESTRATQAVTRDKTRRDMAETEGLQIIDLTKPQAGPVMASIDPVTREAKIVGADGVEKVLKPGQYKEDGSSKGGSGGGPKIPRGVANDIAKAGEALDTSDDLINGFKPTYGGYKSRDVGDIDMFMERNLKGDKTGAAEWWAKYQSKTQAVRHGFYGASFTKSEREEWDKQAINPGMTPAVIKARLNAQREVEDRVARRLAKGWSIAYGAEQVSAFLDRDLGDLDMTPDQPEAAPAAGAGEMDYVPGKGLVRK